MKGIAAAFGDHVDGAAEVASVFGVGRSGNYAKLLH